MMQSTVNCKKIFDLLISRCINEIFFNSSPKSRFGGIDAGMFCILTTLKKEVSRENVFDIYSYCKLYQLRRPRIWPNIDVYLKFHYAAKLLCTRAEVPDVYITMSNGAAAALNGTVTNDCVRVPPEGMEAVGSDLTVA